MAVKEAENKGTKKEGKEEAGGSSGWSFWRWCKKEYKRRTEEEANGRRKGMKHLRANRRSKGWNLGQIGKWIFLFLVVTRNF